MALNKAQKQVLSALAHAVMAKELSANVTGMEGFFDFYINNKANREVKTAWNEFLRSSAQARRDFMDFMERDPEFLAMKRRQEEAG